MDLLKIFCFFSLSFIGGCGSNGTGGEKPALVFKSTLTETLDHYLETTIPDSGGGIAIFLNHNEEIKYSGFKGLANKRPCNKICVTAYH